MTACETAPVGKADGTEPVPGPVVSEEVLGVHDCTRSRHSRRTGQCRYSAGIIRSRGVYVGSERAVRKMSSRLKLVTTVGSAEVLFWDERPFGQFSWRGRSADAALGA
jgi:hypothetical protein